MKYYKDTNNQIYAYEKDGSQDSFILDDMVLIPESEMFKLTRPTQEELIFNNILMIKSLTSDATQKIATLQDAIDLDMAEDGDADKLKKWRKYRVLLGRVDTSVENMELPEKPN